MAMSASDPTVLTGRMEDLLKENEALREQLRRLNAQQAVARGAITEAVAEKEAAAKLAHQVTVEERATRAAVEVQSGVVNTSLVLHILNFFMLMVLVAGLFFWLPRHLEERLQPSTVVAAPGAAVVR